MAPIEYSGPWGKLIFEKNQKPKVSCQTLFNGFTPVYKICASGVASFLLSVTCRLYFRWHAGSLRLFCENTSLHGYHYLPQDGKKPGGLQRDVVYRGWPIAPSYVSPNAGRGGSCAVQYTVQRRPKKFVDPTPYSTYVRNTSVLYINSLLLYENYFKNSMGTILMLKVAIYFCAFYLPNVFFKHLQSKDGIYASVLFAHT
jgi:hypothetical protein